MTNKRFKSTCTCVHTLLWFTGQGLLPVNMRCTNRVMPPDGDIHFRWLNLRDAVSWTRLLWCGPKYTNPPFQIGFSSEGISLLVLDRSSIRLCPTWTQPKKTKNERRGPYLIVSFKHLLSKTLAIAVRKGGVDNCSQVVFTFWKCLHLSPASCKTIHWHHGRKDKFLL